MGIKQAKLKAKGFWAKARKRAEEDKGGAGGTEWEDGRYSALLTRANRNESQSSGRDQVSWTFKGLEGDYKGETIMSHQGLDTEDGQMYFCRDVKRLGFEAPEDIDEIADLLKEIEKKKLKVRIRVKTKGEYQNVYIDKLIGADDVEDAGGADDTADDDDETPELKKGDEVVAKIGGKKVKCTVVRVIDEEDVKVEDEDGEKHTVAIKDVTVPDEEKDDKEEKPDLEDMDRDELEELIDEKDLEVNPKKFKDDDDLREAIEEALKKGDKEEDAIELEKGMKVEFKNKKGKKIEGTVYKVDDEAGEAIVKDEDGEKHTVPFDELEILKED